MIMSNFAEMFLTVACVVLWCWGMLEYILTAVSDYRLAKRRGICGAWLAWVPLLRVWHHGRLADQYQQVMAGRRTKRAATMLTLTILGLSILGVAAMILSSVGEYLSHSSLEPGSLLGLILGILLTIAGCGLYLARKIVGYVVDYNIYHSCKPDSAKTFVVTSIFFSFLKPFYRIGCSGSDEGFVARR